MVRPLGCNRPFSKGWSSLGTPDGLWPGDFRRRLAPATVAIYLAFMSPLALYRPDESLFGNADWTSLGLVSCIIGAFLIANSTLFEHPRSLVARYFGRSFGRLQSVREYVYNRVQTTLGFAFLLAGFGFQLIGQFRTAPAGEAPLSMAWVGVIVFSAIALLFSGWWWSVWAFRRYVREYFTNHPRDFRGEPSVAREVGELFGIESSDDDTVEDYVVRLLRETGLPQKGASSGEPGKREARAAASFGAGRTLPEDFDLDAAEEGI